MTGRHSRSEAGFTVVEMMVTSALLLTVLAIILPLIGGSLNIFTNTQVRSDAVDNSQLALTQLSHDVLSSNLLYQDPATGIFHMQSYGKGGTSTCVEYQVQYPAAPAKQVGVLQRRTKTPGTGSTGWPASWTTVMTGIVNSSQPAIPPAVVPPAVLSTPSSSENRSLAVNLFVQVDTRNAATVAAPENYTSTFTGPGIPANAPATASPNSEPC
jgi:competence protein ComGC